MKFQRFLALFLSQLLTGTVAFAATARFANPVLYPSGGKGANFVVSADVNQDNFPDMIVANTDGISVFNNNADGSGTFQPPAIYGSGGDVAFAVAVGDVNGDGLPDIVVTNTCAPFPGCSNGGVGVLRNDVNNPGTFLTAVPYDAGGIETQAVVIADVTGDGWPDLIVTSNCQFLTCVDGAIYLLPNQGNGTFGPPGAISASMGGPLAIGDLNNDGTLDLVADVGVLLGDGAGHFTPVDPNIGPSSVPGGTISIALQDLDGDGNLDVVVADNVSVKVQLGNGDGTLQQFASFKTGGARPLSVAVADINGDGKPDVLVANECTSFTNGVCTVPGTVAALSGNGDGTFQLPVKYNSGGKLATSVAVADANQDTKPDLFVSNVCISGTNCNSGQIGVFLNTYAAAVTVQVVSSLNPAFVNQPFDLTATLTSSTPIPDGSAVDFSYNGNVIATGTTTNSVATVNVSFAAYGPHTVKATYHGDIWHAVGSGTINQLVHRYSTTTTVMSGNSPEQHGQTVALTATVTSSGPSVPTGTVTFKNGTTTLATKTLSGGAATLNIKTLPVGTLTINAFYNGDSQSAPSSGSTTQIIY
jgi:hypothetical protein